MVNMKYDNQISFHMDALIRPDMQQWLMEHFINVSMDLEGFGNFIFIDNYIDDSYKLFYDEYSMYSYEEIREKVDSYFIEQLVRGAYIFINIDRYYISVNEYTEKQHFVHPILLVGLSKDHTICHCIDFSPSKGRVYLDIPYPELLTSFHKSVEYYQYGSGAGILEECVVSFILKSAFRHGQSNRNHTHYDFRLNRFAAEIHDYITGNVRSGLQPDIYPKNDSHTYYGIKVYDIIYTLYKRSLTENPRMAFKTVYDLALHKKLLKERLQYIQKMYMLSDTALKAIQKYDVVVQKTEEIQTVRFGGNMHTDALRL